MKLTDCPILSPDAILCGGFGADPLLFHPLFGDVVVLSPVALVIWHAVDGQRNVVEIAAQVQAQCEDTPGDIAADVAACLDGLRRRGFVSLESVDRHPGITDTEGRIDGRAQVFGDEANRPGAKVVPTKPLGVVDLSLADGSRFHLAAMDEPAGRVLAQFAAAACLAAASTVDVGQTLYLATVDPEHPDRFPGLGAAADAEVFLVQPPRARVAHKPVSGGRGTGVNHARPFSESEWLWLQLVRLSAFIGQQTHSGGGFLIHSALACTLIPDPLSPVLRAEESRDRGERNDGILLAGRSGVGKSTASRRLPPPWHSLCDDSTLVVRDAGGGYWAHPWPTWSRIFEQHQEDRWDVQKAVPLRAVFVLEQGAADFAQPASPTEAVTLLTELSRQASRHLWGPDLPMPDLGCLRMCNLQRFENVCALVKTLPVYLLDVALEGSFWDEIEKSLAVQTSKVCVTAETLTT